MTTEPMPPLSGRLDYVSAPMTMADRTAYRVRATITDADGTPYPVAATFTGPSDAESAAAGICVVVVTDGIPGGLLVSGYPGVPFGPALFARFYGVTA